MGLSVRHVLRVIHVLILAAAVAAAATHSRAADWDPAWLAAALLAVAMTSDALALRLRNMRISGSFSALVLAMVLMGPAPAVAIGIAAIAVDGVRSRPPVDKLLANLAAYAAFPLLGGLLFQTLHPNDGVLAFTGVVLLVFLVSLVLNFALVYSGHALMTRSSLVEGFRDHFVPVLPAECATGLLTAGLALIGQRSGAGALAVLAGLILIVQYLLRYALVAMERGDQLEERNRQLAALQVGLISTTLKTLALRDNMTARHSAAVARYSRAMAQALGLSQRDQDVIHVAGLFHDVGKFIFPDSILLADRRLTDEDYEIVKRHPVVGAELVGEIEGYGPVAEIVRYHHERIDGLGYPLGLEADDIPLGSRILAVADVYDVITARDTYRSPVTVRQAIAELRRVAGTQLDAHIVEVFIGLVESHGVQFQHSSAHDFEAELALERRVRDYAAPLQAA